VVEDKEGGREEPGSSRSIRPDLSYGRAVVGGLQYEGAKDMLQYAKALLDLYLPEKAEGQSLVEWALILALVSVVAIAILATIGDNIVAVLTDVANALGGS